MTSPGIDPPASRTGGGRRLLLPAAGTLATILIIEFLDELVFGAREAAWPLMRADLALSYTQIGILFAVPGVLSGVIEPVMGVLADAGRRRALLLGGGVLFAVAIALMAVSASFAGLLLATMLMYPASGAFVSLAQTALMDSAPARREQNMARWTLAGSVGVVAGPLALSATLALGLGWRDLFILFAVFAAALVVPAARWGVGAQRSASAVPDPPEPAGTVREGVRAVGQAFRRRDVLRWLALLQFSDLMLDILLGFLALYLVDTAGVSTEQAALGVTVWAGVGLLGDALLIPLLDHVRGLVYLRASAALVLILYPLFLLAAPFVLKLVILGLLGLLNAGWYAILQAQLYTALPGQSGTALAVANLAGLVGSLIPLGLGVVAQHVSLQAAMWLLVAGPLALALGLPRALSHTAEANELYPDSYPER